jgi:hypothetical protein
VNFVELFQIYITVFAMNGVRYSVSEVIRKVLADTDDDFCAISSDSHDSVTDHDHVSEAEAV